LNAIAKIATPASRVEAAAETSTGAPGEGNRTGQD
jgi:hypothetical protein